MKKVLVTGGAGFIGSFVVEKLVAEGHRVTVLDALRKQVHAGKAPTFPRDVRFVRGEVGHPATLRKALKGIDSVIHLAAAVGVGQSMYEIDTYVNLNTYQTSQFLQTLTHQKKKIKKLVVASSMSIYGEGAYRSKDGRLKTTEGRTLAQLRKHRWETRDSDHPNQILRPVPTPETIPLHPSSIYAITKHDQEEMCLVTGLAYGIPTVALRFFNVYGPRQALSNPYTGVVAIFSSRLLNGKVPTIYEDGLQSRDFIHVSDIVQGIYLSLMKSSADYLPLNVGTGKPITIREIAQILRDRLAPGVRIKIENKFRVGDIRHCFADISRIRRTLGYEPRVPFKRGIEDVIAWVREQTADDRAEEAASALRRKGLIV